MARKIEGKIDRFDEEGLNYERCIFTVSGYNDTVLYDLMGKVAIEMADYDGSILSATGMQYIANAYKHATSPEDFRGFATLNFAGRQHDISFVVREF
jgi:hypothetical protein